MESLQSIVRIKGLGNVYLFIGPFDIEIEIFNSIGIKYPVSVYQDSLIRLKERKLGLDSRLQLGTRTCHAPVYAKDSPTIIAMISPAMTDLGLCRKLVEAHRITTHFIADHDKSIYAHWEKIAKADKNKKPKNRRAIILPERGDFKIHKYSDEAKAFFKSARIPYFKEFVEEDYVSVSQINEKFVDSQKGTVLNYVQFDSLSDGSELRCDNITLDVGYGVFGVL
jgi:hypothetical protein